MDLQFWFRAVVMILFATLTANPSTSTGPSAWLLGMLLLTVCLVPATTPFYLLPPKAR